MDLLRDIGHSDLQGLDVLDAGCGVGMISEILFAIGATVHGIDASPIAIDEARDRAGPPPKNPNNFRLGSLVDFNFEKKFDLVFCLDVLYHIVNDQNWTSAVNRLVSHIKPTGKLIIVDQFKDQPERPADHVRFRTREMYDKVVTSAGGVNSSPAGRPGFLVYHFQ